MTNEQIEMLRRLIQAEIDCAKIDGFEHGVWGWAEFQLNEGWEEFRKTFDSDEGKTTQQQTTHG